MLEQRERERGIIQIYIYIYIYTLEITMEEQQQSSPSMEKIITSYEETMALATVTNATTIERVGKVQNDINILNKSFNQKTEKIRMMENLLHKLTSECEQIDNSRSENLTRLYDVEKSRDKLKTRLDNSSQALGKEEVSRWKLQTAHDNAIQDADKMQKEVQRLGKLLHEETIIKDDLAEKLNMLQNERSSTDALVHRLREQLKSSMPAAEVQHLLQAAEKRVYEICEGTKKKLAHMQVSLSKTQIENKKLREQVKLNTASGVSDSKLKDEILLRKRAEKRATEATKRAREMEQRLEFVENETNQLKLMLREAKEGLGVMKTIAKIRGGDNGQGNQSIGFDAVAKKIDNITSNVNRKSIQSNLRSNYNYKNNNMSKRKHNNNKHSLYPSNPSSTSTTRISSMKAYGRPEI